MDWLVDCLHIWYDWMSNFHIWGSLDFLSFVVLFFLLSLIIGIVLPVLEDD